MPFRQHKEDSDNAEARRVLMIASAFPPTGGSGVQRSLKFAKYLPRFSWHPVVWTVDRPLEGLPQDPTFLEELPPEVNVFTYPLKRPFTAGRFLRASWPGTGRLIQAIDWRLARRRANVQMDDCVSWARASIGPLLKLIYDQGVDVIYSTYSPPSNHLLALAIKKRTRLPWVADFRDLWTDGYLDVESSPIRSRADRRLEREFLKEADVVIGVTPRQTEILASHIPSQSHKFVTITNGFDPADFACQSSVRKSRDRFVLAHVGRADRWRINESLIGGLGRFVNRLACKRDRIEIRFVGYVGTRTRARLEAVGSCCSFLGNVHHRAAVQEMREADALLLGVPEGRNTDSAVNAKLFEYLASGLPILAVGPKGGQCERIVRSLSAGLTVGFDAAAVCDALEKLFNAWETGKPMRGCLPSELEPFSRVLLTGKLASLFDELTCGALRNGESSQETAEALLR